MPFLLSGGSQAAPATEAAATEAAPKAEAAALQSSAKSLLLLI